MNFNAKTHLVAVKRFVSLLKRDGKTASTVILTRNYTTTITNLWSAVTNEKRIPLWFLPVSGKLETGGHYQLEGHAGGLIESCKKESHFALTWEFGGNTSWVEVYFKENGAENSKLTLEHTALLSEHWNKYGPGAAGVGWELIFTGLAMYLSEPTKPKPDEIVFTSSPEGKAYIKESSEAWGKVAIKSGTDPDTAHKAVRHTTAFYTGEQLDSS